MSKLNNIAVVGASGLVGRTMIKVLEERNFPLESLSLFASIRSAGKKIKFRGEEVEIKELTYDSFQGIDIALFSAGGAISKEYAPISVKSNCIVVDNSSAWRMIDSVPLIVPEVNPEAIKSHSGIIANPNCSTIQLVVALKPIHDNYGIKRLICSTYQSISGAGQTGLDKLYGELEGNFKANVHPIAFNTMFHPIAENGFTVEENKMKNEICKIMNVPNLPIAITCVRLPIHGGHGESVNLELEKTFQIDEIRELIQNSEGLILMDDMEREHYATPQIVKDHDPVYVSRVRKDDSVENGLYLWVVADNLRKGAATNAIQIAEKLIEL